MLGTFARLGEDGPSKSSRSVTAPNFSTTIMTHKPLSKTNTNLINVNEPEMILDHVLHIFWCSEELLRFGFGEHLCSEA